MKQIPSIIDLETSNSSTSRRIKLAIEKLDLKASKEIADLLAKNLDAFMTENIDSENRGTFTTLASLMVSSATTPHSGGAILAPTASTVPEAAPHNKSKNSKNNINKINKIETSEEAKNYLLEVLNGIIKKRATNYDKKEKENIQMQEDAKRKITEDLNTINADNIYINHIKTQVYASSITYDTKMTEYINIIDKRLYNTSTYDEIRTFIIDVNKKIEQKNKEIQEEKEKKNNYTRLQGELNKLKEDRFIKGDAKIIEKINEHLDIPLNDYTPGKTKEIEDYIKTVNLLITELQTEEHNEKVTVLKETLNQINSDDNLIYIDKTDSAKITEYLEKKPEEYIPELIQEVEQFITDVNARIAAARVEAASQAEKDRLEAARLAEQNRQAEAKKKEELKIEMDNKLNGLKTQLEEDNVKYSEIIKLYMQKIDDSLSIQAVNYNSTTIKGIEEIIIKVTTAITNKDDADAEAAKQAEAARQEAARQEAARQEAARQEAARQEAARKEAARLEAESKLKAQKDAQAKLLVAKKSIKNIINSPNFQKFADFMNLIKNPSNDEIQKNIKAKYNTIQSGTEKFTPDTFLTKITEIIKNTLTPTITSEVLEKYIETLNNFKIPDDIDQDIKEFSSNLSVIDLFKTPQYLNTVKPLNLCFSKIHLDENGAISNNDKKKLEGAINKLNLSNEIKDTLKKNGPGNLMLLYEFMKEANEIHTKINKALKSKSLNNLETAKNIKAKLEEFEKEVKYVTTLGNVRILYETIGGAALTGLRFKKKARENNAPTLTDIKKILSENKTITDDKDYLQNFSVRDYINNLTSTNAHSKTASGISSGGNTKFDDNAFALPNTLQEELFGGGMVDNTMSGGYKYSDLTTIIPDTGEIVIGDMCTNESGVTNYKYGPYAALYDTDFNNFDVYAYLFGINPIKETESNPQEVLKDLELINTKIPNRNTQSSQYGSLVFNGNTPQNFITKLEEGGNIVLFGYGFSGSGKTYTLIEGQTYKPIEKFSGDVTKYNNQKYDPSLLEQFIKDNSSFVTSVDFVDIYPLGILPDNPSTNTNILDKNTIKIFYGTNPKAKENIVSIFGPNIDKFAKAEEKYNSLDKGITYELIAEQIVKIAKHRRDNLRILATPNNNDSSRSFLQITINLTINGKNNKLVFFDMPGSENTVRIKAEFFGEIFGDIENLYKDKDSLGTPSDIPSSYKEDIDNYNKLIKVWKTTSIATKIKLLQEPNQVKDISVKDSYNGYFHTYDVDNRKSHYEFFKNAFITNKNFVNQTGCITTNDVRAYKKFAEVIEELTLFLNRKSIKSIIDLKKDDELKFPDVTIIKKIVSEFFTKVIFKTNKDNENAKNTNTFKYFKMEKITIVTEEIKKIKIGSVMTQTYKHKYYPKQHFNLSENDKNNIKTVYEIPIRESADNDNPIIWLTNGLKSIYNIGTKVYKDAENIQVDNDILSNKDKENIKYQTYSTKKDPDYQNIRKKLATEFEKDPSYKLMYDLRLLTDINFLDNSEPIMKTNMYLYDDNENPNVMIKYFLLIVNNIIYCQENKPGIDTYRAILFFIYKYVNFIVKQGSAIVTNLEHLKFFFLSNTDNIKTYNENNEKQNKSNRNFVCESTDNCKDLIETRKTYNVETTVQRTMDGKELTIQEIVNMGQMDNYRLLAILQDLGNQQSIIKNLQPKLLTEAVDAKSATYTLNLNEPKAGKDTTSITSFSTIVHIKNLLDNENDDTSLNDHKKTPNPKIKTICSAELDSLEFAESISSTTQGKIRSDYELSEEEQAEAAKRKAEEAATIAALPRAMNIVVPEVQVVENKPVAPEAKSVVPVESKVVPGVYKGLAGEEEEDDEQELNTSLKNENENNTVVKSLHVDTKPSDKKTYDVIALYDFEAENPNELSIQEGDTIQINLNPDIIPGEGWLYGILKNEKGELTEKKGKVPADYVKKSMEKYDAIALSDFKAEEDNELSFKKGDRIQINPNIIPGEGWLYGILRNEKDELSKKQGILPLAYVEKITEGGSHLLHPSKHQPIKPPKRFNMKELTKKHKKEKRVITIKNQDKNNKKKNIKKSLFIRRSKKYQE